MPKVRADVLMVSRGLAESREAAQRLILAGRVRSGTLVLVKPAQTFDAEAELSVTEPERYVSRGGLKLEGALREFAIDVSGRVCLDLGASTGGFTDCLLQHGAAGVIAVDVGRAQLHQRLREDPRVRLLEQTNARELPELSIDDWRLTPGATNSADSPAIDVERKEERGKRKGSDGGLSIDDWRLTPGVANSADSPAIDNRRSSIGFFCADLSFISLRKVLPSVAFRVRPGTEGVVLLKPQFEAGPKDVPRGGVIKDAAVLERVRSEFVEWLGGAGWHVYGIIASPIRGGDGNTEFLVHVRTPEEHHGDTEVTEIS